MKKAKAMTDNKEKLFEELYGEHAADMYKARSFVLNLQKELDREYISANSKKHVHVILEQSSPLMLAVVRQIALLIHYSNYDEQTEGNRTVISICCNDVETVKNDLCKSHYLCELMNYCRVNVNNHGQSECNSERNDYLPLDVEIDLVDDSVEVQKDDKNEIIRYITLEEVENTQYDADGIDVRMAKKLNSAYQVGDDINNLTAIDVENVAKYEMALNFFCYNMTDKEINVFWNGEKTDKASSLCSADSMISRLSVLLAEYKKNYEKNEKKALKWERKHIFKAVRDNISKLASHEHSRWNVEKLVFGFLPYNKEQRYRYESLFKNERAQYKKKLRTDQKVHIDLCSNKDLERIDPENVKFDVFIMLAMPYIVAELYDILDLVVNQEKELEK